ncbi:conserved hypothetical protein [Dinoroseobacter shibae DFL 12 = DSM 16493]|jgi:uncharacterized protein YkwD|uniref:SCP domain-containing protein n=1 Tax=Dinoroseobacter shibae (strain DSM 16493 / NCIMB 14021 / DFL 12) TaxID=398580 RepID=A8LJ10_DINSH|nr:CAP domain-containing protein [Dinoroseobacter shibae]ABV94505.1 conserved hypothetical protein [Dinoroseobacter shibae DFL 12 = DSM 16493]URF45932.1 CAP domain-containing protein [Dinoroseobacter shibae]URF50238.1 CAP domain-containing protein [Dinoroseobacter shibae]
MRRALWALALGLAGCSAPQAPTQPGPSRALPAPDLIAAVNEARSAVGVAALAEDPALSAAAMAHAADMAQKGYFDHRAPDGSTPLRRMRAAGYDACYAAENLAKGQPDAGTVLGSWTRSEGHRSNMLSPNPRAAGAGRGPGNIWVLTLARAC